MRQIFLYSLAIAAEVAGIRVHAATLMSNHYHVLVTDTLGQIPAFAERLNLLLTKATQVYRGWNGSVFDAAGPSYVECLTPAAIVKEAAYVIANPTAAGLVRYARDWPGVRTRVDDIGSLVIVVERPKIYFDEEGDMPERIELRFEMPDALLDESPGHARERIATEVERQEEIARYEVRAAGRSFLGAERAQKLSPYKRAKTYEQRGRLRPRYACGGDGAALEAAIARDADFQERYAMTRARWLDGERDVEWPAGTYLMHRVHRVRRAEPP